MYDIQDSKALIRAQRKSNKVIRVNYAGGLLGWLFGSSRGKLESVVNKHNEDGWNVVQVVPENLNMAHLLFRTIIFFLTLTLWTLGSSVNVIMERPVEI